MSIKDIIKEELNKTFTTNGDNAFYSTGSSCLDFFIMIGSLHLNDIELINAFTKAYYENPLLAVKIIFYARDIRGGLGKRSYFRLLINYISHFMPEVAKQIISLVPKYGRYDDLFAFLYTDVEGDVISLIKKQLEEDKENKLNKKSISLLCKWMPSINTSNNTARKVARHLCDKLGLTCGEYRKLLSTLRKNIIIENNLRLKDYSFDYSKIPSQAFLKYKNAFMNNDKERYLEFINPVGEDTTGVIHTGTLYPYQVTKKALHADKDDELSLDAIWKNFDRSTYSDNTIVVRDGSGSMYCGLSNPLPIDVSTSIALLFSEQLTGEFKNTFITFSARPELVEVPEGTIVDKVKFCSTFEDCSNTNIEKVYELLLNVAKNKNVSKEEMIKRIIIVSDMQFDASENHCRMSTLQRFKSEYAKLGFELPSICFWNVANNVKNFTTTKTESGVIMVSGSSQHTIEQVMSGNFDSPYDYMINVLSKYSDIDSLIF